MRDLAGLRLLERQHEPFAAREEVGPRVVLGRVRLARKPLRDEPLVGLEHRRGLRGRRAIVEPPPFRMRRVAEAAVEKRSDEVEGHRGTGVAAEQERRVGRAVRRREALAIDEVASVARQRDAADRLGGRGARLRVLPGDPPHEDRLATAGLGEHEPHAKEDLELRGNERRAAVGEAFGAVAALQEEAASLRRLGQLPPQPLDLEARDDGRQFRELREAPPRRGGVGILRLVQAWVALPGRR